MGTLPDLPKEILTEIFLRLPTKSIGQSRSLSKYWCNLLSTQQFIKAHLAREKTRQEYLILVTPSHTIHSVKTIKEKDNTVSTKLDLPGSWSNILGSCDGLLLLLSEDDEEMFLANPITLEQEKIPDSPLSLKKHKIFRKYGFGYDSVVDDYKVVTLTYYPWCPEAEVDVYSVKTGVWKRIEITPYLHCCPDIPSGAYINGAIHLAAVGSDESDCPFITALGLSDEVFIEIPTPSGVDVENFLDNILVVLGGCLCLIDTYSERGGIDVWVMREYGVANSWTKLRIYGVRFGDLFRPLCFIGDEEEIVLVFTGLRLVVYNVKEGSLRDLVVDAVPGEFVDGGIFVESLVSPAALFGAQRELSRKLISVTSKSKLVGGEEEASSWCSNYK